MSKEGETRSRSRSRSRSGEVEVEVEVKVVGVRDGVENERSGREVGDNGGRKEKEMGERT